MNKKDFLDKFSNVYEKSPWVAERSYERIKQSYTFINVKVNMSQTVQQSTHNEKLKLLRNHPDLGFKRDKYDELTSHSQNEQRSAGLNSLSKNEYETFHQLNNDYKQRFKFPFILAVYKKNKFQILEIFKNRNKNSLDEEFNEAINQVHKIAEIRIRKIIQGEKN